MALQALLYALDLNNGPRRVDTTGRRGDLVDIDLEYAAADGSTVREPVESWIRDTRTGKTKTRSGWVFVGSTLRDGVFLAEEEGNICLNYCLWEYYRIKLSEWNSNLTGKSYSRRQHCSKYNQSKQRFWNKYQWWNSDNIWKCCRREWICQ